MGRFTRLISGLYEDGFKALTVFAPILSIAFVVCKVFDVVSALRDLPYAWALLPLTVWLLVAYVRRWGAYERLTAKPEPDMPLADAINYMVNDSTAVLRQVAPAEIARSGPAKGKLWREGGVPHSDARNKIQEKLITGEMVIYGLRERSLGLPLPYFDSVSRPIPQSYWDHASLDFLCSFHVTSTASQTILQGGVSDYRWSNLKVSRQQVERFWPKKHWWQRAWCAYRKVPHVDYWGRKLDRQYRLVTPNAETFIPTTMGQYVSIRNGAIYLHNSIEKSGVAKGLLSDSQAREQMIEHLIHGILANVDGVYGKRVPSTEESKIEMGERSKLHPITGKNELRSDFAADQIKYTDVCVLITELSEYADKLIKLAGESI